MRPALLVLALSCVLPTQLRAQQRLHLVLPDPAARKDAAGVTLPADATRRLGSGLFRVGGAATWKSPSFSPDGNIVYVVDSDLVAFDAQTGLRRFTYSLGGLNVKAAMEGRDGIRLDVLQGVDEGDFLVLEHGTGKEVNRGHKDLPKSPGRESDLIPLAENRAIISTPIRESRKSTPVPSHRSSLSLWDLDANRTLLDLGKHENSPEGWTLSPDQHTLALCHKGTMLRLVDIDAGKVIQEIPLQLEGHDFRGFLPVWSRDSAKVYAWRRVDRERQIVEVDAKCGAVRVVVSRRPLPVTRRSFRRITDCWRTSMTTLVSRACRSGR